MTEAKRPLKVFLCHAHADRDAVKALYTRLTKDGVDSWLDKEKLLPGQDWELEIRKAVREADVVVVCLSKQFNQAGFRQKEVRLALDTAMEQPEGEIFIIPARLEECDTLESLKKWQRVDLFEESGYRRLMLAFNEKSKRIGAVFEPQKQYLVFTSSDKSFVMKVATELDKQLGDEKPSSWETIRDKIVAIILRFVRWGNVKPMRKTKIVFALFIFAGTITAGLLGSPLLEKWFSPAPVVTQLVTSTVTITPKPITPSHTFEPSLTSTTTVTLTTLPRSTVLPSHEATPIVKITATEYAGLLPMDITDAKGVPMDLVPEGEFVMGSEDGGDDEKPAHRVYLDSFYIDRVETANVQYRKCVDSGACKTPEKTDFRWAPWSPDYYGDSTYDYFPIIYVDWYMAKTYCEWRGARLPTEAEWEKAARGTDGRTYPWNEAEVLTCDFANYTRNGGYACWGITVRIGGGNYAIGRSSYGVFQMAGNIQEWVSSLYQPYPYNASDGREDLSASGSRVARGGSWYSREIGIRTTSRVSMDPAIGDSYTGIRCAKDASP